MKFKSLHSTLSLKNQLILYFILIAIIPTSVISVYYYTTSRSTLEKSIAENQYKIVSNIMDNIENKIEQANQLTDWIYIDKNIINLLRRRPTEANIFDAEKKQAIDNIEKQFRYLPVTEYISSFFILGNNGIDLRNGTDAHIINVDLFKQEKWFSKGQEANGLAYWGGIYGNYTSISSEKYVVTLFRMIKDIDSGKNLGHSILFFKQKFFEDCYKGISLDKGEILLLIDREGTVLFSNRMDFVATNISTQKIYTDLAKKDRYFFGSIDNANKELIVHKKSAQTGWTLIKAVSMTEIQNQKKIAANTTILLIAGTMLMCGLFSFFLSGNFTKPIQMLVKYVNEIAQGNFNESIKLKGQNEIGELGKNINKMSSDIQNLMEEGIRKEREKRKAEIKMLQNQINPHFLYNTLNSIKWMASLQGADGIGEMVSRLGRILKAILGNMNEKILLSDELNILDDYIYIQKIRYKGKINFYREIDDDRLLQCYVMKFILQPIVENAIFHGIEPKEGIGEIKLSIRRAEEKLVLEVWDNGIGISDKKMNSVLEKHCKGKGTKGLSGIGLCNIHERIQLMYGKEYGLSFESVKGEYTKVLVSFPLEYIESEVKTIESINC